MGTSQRIGTNQLNEIALVGHPAGEVRDVYNARCINVLVAGLDDHILRGKMGRRSRKAADEVGQDIQMLNSKFEWSWLCRSVNHVGVGAPRWGRPYTEAACAETLLAAR